MSRIIILAGKMHMGGTEVALLALLRELVRHKEDVTLLLLEKEGVLLEQIPESVKVDELEFTDHKYLEHMIWRDSKNPIESFFEKVRCKPLFLKYRQNGKRNTLYPLILKHTKVLREKYDLLLDFHGYGIFMTAYGAVNITAKKKALWFHDENLHWLGKTREYFRYYDKLFCVSRAVVSALEKACPEEKDKIEVFYNLTDTEKIRRKAQEPLEDKRIAGENIILTIGRLDEQKGLDIAIEAAELLKKRSFTFSWFVIGDGLEKAALETQISRRKVGDCFFLLGRIMNPYPYLKRCDLYVQPSRHEGYCTTIVEAKTLAKPIIVSDIESFKEQITDGVNGVVSRLDAADLADKIQYVLEQKELQEHLKEKLSDENMDYRKEYCKIEKWREW